MTHLLQIFEKLNLSQEKGLYITTEDNWDGLFSNRVGKLIDKIIKPDAFFCIDNKPFILFFENLSDLDKENKLKEIWNFNESPIIIIVNVDSVEIYNGFNYLADEKTLELFGNKEKLDDFSYFKLVTGKTWDDYQKHFKYDNRIDYHLLDNIKNARKQLINANLSTELANSLLGKVIFVRYLIDREVKLDFEREGTSRTWTTPEFCDLLADKNKIKAFFKYLKKKFNGDLFPIDDDDIDSVSDECFSVIRNLLSGYKIETGQISLFDLYDFSIIPVEFISNVYELFIGQSKQEKEGAYYTPLFLVDYILAETVEKKFINQPDTFGCKVLDPACGSGIFLVETLRKIIEQYQKNNPNYNSDPEKYKQQLIKLVTQNIFGVDKDKSAINVAIFSIYLTLLDYQEPSDIESFRFPLLKNKNFFKSDFFNTKADFNTELKKLKFDFILGNPPWKRGKGDGKPLFEEYIKDRRKEEKGNDNIQIEISDSQIAEAFVLRVSDFCQSTTKIGLIVFSKILYNTSDTAKDFRQYLLNRFLINKVFELAPVRREVFDKSNDKAISPASILFYQYVNGLSTDDNTIEHITLKPSRFFSLFKVFTIQRGDYKKVNQKQLKLYDFLWKVLVYGSYLDFNLLIRLQSCFPTKIKDVVFHGKDYIVKQGMKRKDGKNKFDVHKLVGIDFIDLKKKQLKQFCISPHLDKWKLDTVGYVYRENGKVANTMFNPPVLLIRATAKTNLESVSTISKSKVVFTDSITAIKRRDNSDDDNYYNIAALLNSKLFSYYICQTGSVTGILTEQQIHETERFSFPYINNNRFKQIIKKIEHSLGDGFFEIDDKTKQLKNELDTVVIDSFDLSDQEKDTVDYTVNCVIPSMMKPKSRKILLSPIPIKSKTFSEYINLYFERFNNTYKKLNQKLIVDIKHTKQVVGLFFKLVDIGQKTEAITYTPSENSDILQFLTALGTEKITDRLFVQKDIRGFEENGFYIIKPNEQKLWHKAIGHLDVNEIADAILKAGKKATIDV